MKQCIFSSLILQVVIMLKRERGMVWTHEVPTTDSHRLSANHPKFHQNSPRAVYEWGMVITLTLDPRRGQHRRGVKHRVDVDPFKDLVYS